MAIVQLTPQATAATGITPTRTGSLSTSNTYKVRNHKPFLLHFQKSGAGSCNVVLTSPAVPGQRAAISTTVAVPATTGDVVIGPFDPAKYNNTEDVAFTVSEVTGLTVAVLQLPRSQRKL